MTFSTSLKTWLQKLQLQLTLGAQTQVIDELERESSEEDHQDCQGLEHPPCEERQMKAGKCYLEKWWLWGHPIVLSTCKEVIKETETDSA